MTIQQIPDTKSLIKDLFIANKSAWKYTEKIEGNLKIIKLINLKGKTVKEIILVN